MDSSVSGKDEIWFLRVCHHVPHELYWAKETVQLPDSPHVNFSCYTFSCRALCCFAFQLCVQSVYTNIITDKYMILLSDGEHPWLIYSRQGRSEENKTVRRMRETSSGVTLVMHRTLSVVSVKRLLQLLSNNDTVYQKLLRLPRIRHGPCISNGL